MIVSDIYLPREDSYLLLKVLEKEIPKFKKINSNLTFLEIGAGSGILLEKVFKLGIDKKNIFAVDINLNAVKNCKEIGFNCIYSNLFEKVSQKFDIIIFNPPYLPEDSREPKSSQIATTGGKKGSEIINRFLKEMKDYINKNGIIFLLTSSLTKGILWGKLDKKLIAKEKIFFEELFVWKIRF